MVVSYAFKIYQKLKFDNDLVLKSLSLCKCLSKNLSIHKQNQNLKNDFEKVMKYEENWLDKSIVISYFLSVADVSSWLHSTLLFFFFLVIILQFKNLNTNLSL